MGLTLLSVCVHPGGEGNNVALAGGLRVNFPCGGLRPCAGFFDIAAPGERHTHAPGLVTDRFSKQAQLGFGHLQRVSDAGKLDAVCVHAAIDNRACAGIAQGCIDRQAENGAGIEGRFGLGLRH